MPARGHAITLLTDPDFGAEAAVRRWTELAGDAADQRWVQHLHPVVDRLLDEPGAAGELLPLRLIGTALVELPGLGVAPHQMVFICGGPSGRTGAFVARSPGWRRRPLGWRLQRRLAGTSGREQAGVLAFDAWDTASRPGSLVLRDGLRRMAVLTWHSPHAARLPHATATLMPSRRAPSTSTRQADHVGGNGASADDRAPRALGLSTQRSVRRMAFRTKNRRSPAGAYAELLAVQRPPGPIGCSCARFSFEVGIDPIINGIERGATGT